MCSDVILFLLQAHGKIRILGSLVSKLITFLQNFVTYDPQRVSTLLQQYVPVFRSVHHVHLGMEHVHQLGGEWECFNSRVLGVWGGVDV